MRSCTARPCGPRARAAWRPMCWPASPCRISKQRARAFLPPGARTARRHGPQRTCPGGSRCAERPARRSGETAHAVKKNILPKRGKRDIHCNSCQALEECSGRSSASCTICLAFFWRTKRKRSCPGAWPFVACLRFRSDIPRELRFGQRHTGTTLRAIRPPADRGPPARHRHTEAQPLPT